MAVDEQAEFFAELPALTRFVDVVDGSQHAQVPSPWLVVVTDVVNSTEAVAAGRYRDVNVLGAATIACAINAYPEPRPPYVFGGDGAVILVPPSRLPRVGPALNRLAWMAREEMGLELRAGAVPVGELLARGKAVRVAKYALADGVELAMLAGSGVDEATRRVKGEDGARYSLISAERPAIGKLLVKGLNCRWEPIRSRRGEMVSLIVKALPREEGAQTAVYRQVLAFLDELLAGVDYRPVSVETAVLAHEPALLAAEATVKSGRRGGLGHVWQRAKIGLVTRVGAALMRRGQKLGDFDGARYPQQVVEQSDVRKFDAALRMVIDVTEAEHAELEAFLAERFRAGELVYGTAASNQALMTCLVYDRVKDHVHFVDGDGGGHTAAARQLGQRMREREDGE